MGLQPLTSKGVKFFKFGEKPSDYAGETTYLPQGSVKTGHFQGTQEVTFSDGDKGTTHYFFDKEEGQTYGISGSSRLNGILGSVDKGVLIELTYDGKKKTPKGRMAHAFSVRSDPSDLHIETRKEASKENGTDSAEPSPSQDAPELNTNDIPL